MAALFERGTIASLATLGEDGLPHVVPMWVHLDGDRVYIPTSSSTVKVRNLERDNRAALMVHQSEGSMSVRGALIRGHITILRGEEAKTRNSKIHQRYLTADELAQDRVAEYLAGDDVTLVLVPQSVRSWDLSSLVEGLET